MNARVGNFEITRAAGVPIAQMIRGLTPEAVAEMLPRLFNLCRSAQATAAHLALGLPAPVIDLTGDVIRDHVLKLFVTWPAQLGLAPLPLPTHWQAGGEGLLRALFDGPFPETVRSFQAACGTGRGIAPVLAALDRVLPPGTGVAAALPALTDTWALSPVAVENSVAGRQASHTVLRSLEVDRGRDLYWRAVARLYDLADACRGALPAPRVTDAGVALVPASRGTYALTLRQERGRITGISRITPTDHLCAPGGILEITFAALNARDAGKSGLVMDILDPCHEIGVRALNHA
ncbi:hydrogenase expression/formation protein HupK [Maritimibacter dapengensis]|uniref:Hydrogenase expression/formation protein HupK n=1 Tax=Maritimibacter dapengensis TaxID=2836868 RepID=A0ABS6T670_9RHOB|nr:hydrogenase expression/formation protein HupK [Maritimibacter dapengensis]MBV7380773.1 hydrogenase expression/formation protein HupK [Maritimibacter dapengensis]